MGKKPLPKGIWLRFEKLPAGTTDADLSAHFQLNGINIPEGSIATRPSDSGTQALVSISPFEVLRILGREMNRKHFRGTKLNFNKFGNQIKGVDAL
jgi:hypothetical protein